MSFFTTRADSEVLVVTFETAAGLNDFRNSAPTRLALRPCPIPGLAALRHRPRQGRLPLQLGRGDPCRAQGRVETKGGQMVIYHLQPIVHDLLGIMKLDRFFSISEDEDAGRVRASPAHGLTGSFVFLDTPYFLSCQVS